MPQLPPIINADGIPAKQSWQRTPWSYLIACSFVAAMTGFIYIVHADKSMSIIPMMYLLTVTAAAFLLGSLPAVLASVIAFLAFDWFYVEPRYQFTVQDPAEWIALGTFLLIAILTGQLTALLRARAEEAQRRKQETFALAEASWAIASQLDRDGAMKKVVSQLAQVVNPDYVAVMLPAPDNTFTIVTEYRDSQRPEEVAVSPESFTMVLTKAESIGWESIRYGGMEPEKPWSVYLPILLEDRVLGVLFIQLKPEAALSSSQKQVVTSIVNHAAVIIQRDILMKAEAKAQALAEADKLKTALLSMVSHDFRSPLTSIKASVSSLLADGNPLDWQTQQSLLQGVDHEADRLNGMVGNILGLSRLEAGAWGPRQETVDVKELVGSALDSFDREQNKRIRVDIDSNVDEIVVDSVQMVQVVKNLVENALKYSPAETFIDLKITNDSGSTVIEVMDRGGGLPKGQEEQIFKPFFRAPGLVESSIPGVGIGLALCRGLVDANGGTLSAANREGGGAAFRVTLPWRNGTEPHQKRIHESSSYR